MLGGAVFTGGAAVTTAVSSEVAADSAQRAAALPLVGEGDRWTAAPRAGIRGQRLTVLGGAGHGRWSRARGRDGGDRRGLRGRRRSRSGGVGGGEPPADRAAGVDGA